MSYLRVLFVAIAFGGVLVGGAFAGQQRSESSLLRGSIQANRASAWYWQDVAQIRRTRTSYDERWAKGLRYLRWLNGLWRRRNHTARLYAQNPPHKSQWLCIHRYEGSWTDPGSPYYGGLQMDREFQATYGPRLLSSKGTADHWTPLEQMWVAERAFKTRGFWPWPNTARYCGLL